MKNNLKRAALLAGALAATVALPAAAQSSASASIEHFGFHLVDLNPNDCIVPSIRFGPGLSYSVTSITDLNGNLVQQVRTDSFGPVGFNSMFGSGTGFTDAHTAKSSLDVLSGSGYANAVNAFYFVLSANTRVDFTADGLASSYFSASTGNSFAQALMTGSLKDSYGNLLTGADTDLNARGSTTAGPMFLSLSTQGTALSGSLILKIETNGSSMISPVPEPASYAMLAVGASLLAGLARRRSAKATRA
jgi:PEP-CTERM motif